MTDTTTTASSFAVSGELRGDEVASARERQPLIGEDWLAVYVGAALIALVLAGVRPAMPRFAWGTAETPIARLVAADNIARTVQTVLLVLGPVIAGAAVLRANMPAFVPGALLLYVLGWLAQAMAGYVGAAGFGLEYVIFALAIGLVVNHTIGVPKWLREGLRTEYYIKTGLVVLGATILFDEIVGAGMLGIMQAIIVVLSVWAFAFWLARRLRVDDEMATMLASAVSICGVSAAIAVCGAIQGDKKKLSYVTSLVLLVAMPMMVLMPLAAKAMGMSSVVAGAWLGGTLDTSAAVVAAGELLGNAGRNAAVVVKLSQNALIGFAAFFLTIWWAMRHEGGKHGASVGLIWDRFPKFVFGFLLASLVFSFVLSDGTVAATRGLVNDIRTVLFAMAFVSIGLETSLRSVVTTGGGRPAAAFLGGQAFNLIVTLIAAYAFFGGLFFALPAL
jgi:uncharacterized integral membrane protein (TIGR00698 family)